MPSTSYGLQDFDLLTLREVAAALHCSKAHVSNLIAGHVPGCSPIPAVHLGRRMLVRRESLLTWLARNEHTNDSLKASPEQYRKSA
jgi:excisionase family DNA binding protein